MRVLLRQSVLDAALARIRYLFNEFEHIVVNVSGGKDSTVVLNLSLQVAEEMGRLPLDVMFLDQEAEWQCVIDHVRDIMHDPRVNPLWYQIPLRIFNATSTDDEWLHCWREGEAWIREKEPDSIHENTFGTDRFAELFTAIMRTRFPSEPAAYIAGVRAEESPGRRFGLTNAACYKWITWGNASGKANQQYTFYPLYDWSYTDVWTAIHRHGWKYCPLYDYMYQYGTPVMQMRVSNVHHETAVKSLFFLQEIEPDTWNRITARIHGANAASHLNSGFFAPKVLPPMFKSWREYRDHLLENLVGDEHRERMRIGFRAEEQQYDPRIHEKLWKTQIRCVLTNDYHGTQQRTFAASNHQWMVHGRYGKGSDPNISRVTGDLRDRL